MYWLEFLVLVYFYKCKTGIINIDNNQHVSFNYILFYGRFSPRQRGLYHSIKSARTSLYRDSFIIRITNICWELWSRSWQRQFCSSLSLSVFFESSCKIMQIDHADSVRWYAPAVCLFFKSFPLPLFCNFKSQVVWITLLAGCNKIWDFTFDGLWYSRGGVSQMCNRVPAQVLGRKSIDITRRNLLLITVRA